MAEFRGLVQGNRGGASRLGSKSSGMVTDCDTWTFGARCRAWHNDETGENEILVYSTGGSQNSSMKLIAIITSKDDVELIS
jgi:hypothetical protein